MRPLLLLLSLILLLAPLGCGAPASVPGLGAPPGDDDDAAVPTPDWPLGGTVTADALQVAVRSTSAEHLQLEVFAQPFGAEAALSVPMNHTDGLFHATVPRADLDAAGITDAWYGLRAWGPNWPHDPSWTPGSDAGFLSDVDADGHRFNPNKLLWDPYARELSHDPEHAQHQGWHQYTSGPDNRLTDTASFAPKGLALPPHTPVADTRPLRPLKDQVIYEVHPRGLTMADESIPEELRGTYAGAALKAPYLADLGVTAIELLPIHETPNDQNDLTPDSAAGDNYWGYTSLSFFAPDRRYAADQSAGGPTAEFRAMVEAFHAEGIAVYLDVVYNHTAESGTWDGEGQVAPLFSWRGLDNPGYYEIADDARWYVNNNGVGPNVNVARQISRDLVIDSLRYWVDSGVDGFRFDLASILGNSCARGCFSFDANDPNGVLRRAVAELPDTVLIAEPWGIGNGTYQVGAFPPGWAEWNDHYRDDVRTDLNLLDVEDITTGWLANRFSGSWELFGDDGRPPGASINFVAAHDGLTHADIFACNGSNNGQDWPWGPSDGGTSNNRSWDFGGDPDRQVHAARTAMALLLLSAGTPMITGGDEFLRTQQCNNNAYNLDSPGNWLAGTGPQDEPEFHRFTRNAMQFRHAHAALRPSEWRLDGDGDSDGQWLIEWYTPHGRTDAQYLDDPANHYVGFRLDADEVDPSDVASIFVGYNGWNQGLDVLIPEPAPGNAWYLVADSHPWMADWLPVGDEALLDPDDSYLLGGRSVVVLIER